MTNAKLIGTRVAKSANKNNTEFYNGTIINTTSDKALVKFENHRGSYWCNKSSLLELIKSKN